MNVGTASLIVLGTFGQPGIARRLVVSIATAKTHVSRAMVKLGARDRAQLVVPAHKPDWSDQGWLR